ncbi:MAG: AI-2E family transporter [Alphaproteobacteria bacterium GM202ARS2]|nr:AI-2E family transporter [Alphaproteobacteria bacterium GM202ARS2]
MTRLSPSFHLFVMTLTLFALPFVLIAIFHDIMLPFFLGAVLAYILDPLADRFEDFGLSRVVATACVLLLVMLVCVFLLLLLVPPLIHQTAAFIQSLPSIVMNVYHLALAYVSQLVDGDEPSITSDALLEPLRSLADTYVADILSFAKNVFVSIFDSGRILFEWLALMLLTPLTTFYLLNEWDKIVSYLRELLPQRNRAAVVRVVKDFDASLAQVARGLLALITVMAVYYGIGLSLIIPYGFILGLLSGVLLLIPYLGWSLGLVLSCLVAWFEVQTLQGVGFVAALFLVGQFIESFFLTPQLVGRSGGMHPLALLFALLVGGSVLGFIGVLLAPLFTVMALILTRVAVAAYRDSTFFKAMT